jgi:hypothetical protein
MELRIISDALHRALSRTVRGRTTEQADTLMHIQLSHMNVFISWSKPMSHAVAEALREWLPVIFQEKIHPFLSSQDIGAGQRGLEEIASQLSHSDVGIVCLTRENLESTWIHFEAGAISKSISEARLCTLLVDVSMADLAAPLSLFQASSADRAGVRRIVDTINKALTDRSLPDHLLERTFNLAWGDLEASLSSIRQQKGAELNPIRTEKEILDEVLALVRSSSNATADLYGAQSHMRKAVADLAHEVSRIRSALEFIRLSASNDALREEQDQALDELAKEYAGDAKQYKDDLLADLRSKGLNFSADAFEQSEVSIVNGNRVIVRAPERFRMALSDPDFVRVAEEVFPQFFACSPRFQFDYLETRSLRRHPLRNLPPVEN